MRDAVLRRRRWGLVHGLRLLIALEFLGHSLVFGEEAVMFATCGVEIMTCAVQLLLGMLAMLDGTFELFDIVGCCDNEFSIRPREFL